MVQRPRVMLVLLFSALSALAMAEDPSDCPLGCSSQGHCVGGSCVCYPGWTGLNCSEVVSCTNDCTLRGVCVNATCQCYPGFTGDDCSGLLCPHDCSHRGTCRRGVCTCDAGFAGDGCEKVRCPADCTSPERFEACDDGVQPPAPQTDVSARTPLSLKLTMGHGHGMRTLYADHVQLTPTRHSPPCSSHGSHRGSTASSPYHGFPSR